SAQPSSLTVAGDSLYFLAFDGSHGYKQLWATDGTEAGTRLAAPGLEASPPMALGGSVVFDAYNPGDGRFGVWSTDGSPGGARRVADLPPSNLVQSSTAQGSVFFEIYDFQTGKYELWRSDGTSSGTGLVAPVAFSYGFASLGSRAFFVSTYPAHGYELWSSD